MAAADVVPARDGGDPGLGKQKMPGEAARFATQIRGFWAMRLVSGFFVVAVALAAPSPVAAARAADAPFLVVHGDGSATLTGPIESDPPHFVWTSRDWRPAHAGARARRERDFDRAFQEATDQAREAARLPKPR
jgi:hypothetical protein